MKVVRPSVPNGYVPDSTSPRFLSWEDVRERLSTSLHYWLATVYPDGRPHVVPRWGVWLDDSFWYDGSPETRHVRNVAANPACVLHLESGAEAVIVHGNSVASSPITGDLGKRLSAEFGRKYEEMGYVPAPDAWSDEIAGGLRILKPIEVLAWTDFPSDLTKFQFSE